MSCVKIMVDVERVPRGLSTRDGRLYILSVRVWALPNYRVVIASFLYQVEQVHAYALFPLCALHGRLIGPVCLSMATETISAFCLFPVNVERMTIMPLIHRKVRYSLHMAGQLAGSLFGMYVLRQRLNLNELAACTTASAASISFHS
jgi:hypothetical protein